MRALRCTRRARFPGSRAWTWQPKCRVASRTRWRGGSWQLGRGLRMPAADAFGSSHTTSASSGTFCGMLADRGCNVTVVPAKTTAAQVLRTRARRRVAVERPRRSGAVRLRDTRHSANWWRRGCRCSASVSATSCCRSRAARATLKMTHGHHGANHPVKDLRQRPRDHHQPEPRLRGRRSDAACRIASKPRTYRCSMARCKACAAPIDPRSVSRDIPEAVPVRTTCEYLFDQFIGSDERGARRRCLSAPTSRRS